MPMLVVPCRPSYRPNLQEPDRCLHRVSVAHRPRVTSDPGPPRSPALMTLRTAKLLWLFLGLTPIAETLTSGADKTAIAGGVIYLLGAVALHRAERRDPRGE